MNAYFSQLARHTGLNFEIGGTTAAVSSSPPPKVPVQHGSRQQESPLHVEEVTYTSPAQLTPDRSERTNEDIVGHKGIEPISSNDDESMSDGLVHRARLESGNIGPETESKMTPPASIEISPGVTLEEATMRITISESRANSPAEYSDDEYPAQKPSSGIERAGFVISHEPSTAVETSGPTKLFERGDEFDGQSAPEYGSKSPPDKNRQARRLEGKGQEPVPSAKAGERREANVEEQMEQEVIVRNYLKEIRDWVAAPSEMNERETEFRTSGETHQRSRDELGLEYGKNAALALRPGRSEEPELQDLSLSIGTISIVIEEPRKEAAVLQALPAKTERVSERTTTESTNLSRYYLRSW